jgi:hypothetical protein
MMPALQEVMKLFRALGPVIVYGIVKPVQIWLDGIAAIYALMTGTFNEYLDKKAELEAERKASLEADKQEVMNKQDLIGTLKEEVGQAKHLIETKKKVTEAQKEMNQILQSESKKIEDDWYKTKYGDAAPIKKIEDKIAELNAGIDPDQMTADERLRKDKFLLDETRRMKAEQDQEKRQKKLLDDMARELAATKDLIWLKERGIVASEADLKKLEKMREFGDGAKSRQFAAMLEEKAWLEQQTKELAKQEQLRDKILKKQSKTRQIADLKEELALVQRMFDLKEISKEVFDEMTKEIAGNIFGLQKKPDQVGNVASMVQSGSVESYKMQVDMREKAAERQEQRRFQADLLIEVRELNRNMREKGVVTKK